MKFKQFEYPRFNHKCSGDGNSAICLFQMFFIYKYRYYEDKLL